jgi:hypothetical protein
MVMGSRLFRRYERSVRNTSATITITPICSGPIDLVLTPDNDAHHLPDRVGFPGAQPGRWLLAGGKGGPASGDQDCVGGVE